MHIHRDLDELVVREGTHGITFLMIYRECCRGKWLSVRERGRGEVELLLLIKRCLINLERFRGNGKG